MHDESNEPPQAPEVTIPKGFHVPEPKEDKPNEFELVSKWRVKPDGKTMCLTKLGDFEFDYDEDEKGEYEQAPNYRGYAKSMLSAMDGEGMG